MSDPNVKKQKSLAKNSFWYLLYTSLNLIFPFITGVYIARVLLPNTIGIVTAAQNVVTYFAMFAFLGIPTYGMREISKNRYDKESLNKIYSELMVINFISTFVFSVLYFSLIFIVKDYRENTLLFLILGIIVVMNVFNNTWLFDGLEELKFISIRNLVFKIIVFFLLIMFVKSDKDYLIYAVLLSSGIAGNNIINIVYSKKMVKFSLNNLNLKRHMKSIIFLTMVNLAIEIYTLVDVTMLDFLSTKESVTFYSYGAKINRILLQVINTFTMVLVPRISLYYKEKKFDEYNKLLENSLKLILLFSIPMIIGIQFVSKYLLTRIYGPNYILSAYVLNILCFTLMISPIGYLLGSRTLLVTGNENKMIIAVGTGAIANIIMNYIFISLYNEIGAAFASLISELIVCLIYIYLGQKYYKINKKEIFISIGKILVSSLVMLFALLLLEFVNREFIKCLLQIVCGIIVYFALLILMKEKITMSFLKKILNKLRKR